MTAPNQDMIFQNDGGADQQSITATDLPSHQQPGTNKQDPYPKTIVIKFSDDTMAKFTGWIDYWLLSMNNGLDSKLKQWAEEERDYRAKSLGPQSLPYQGASGDVVPAIAMAVDPIHARLDTGIFKADPVFVIKALRKSMVDKVGSLEKFINFYQKHRLNLRQVASPRILECTKHGTMIYKVVYDQEKYAIKTYDNRSDWKVIKKEVVRFQGPRVFGVSINDFLFPAHYQNIQDVPIMAERMRVSYGDLKIAEKSGKLQDCDKVENYYTNQRTELEEERAASANHRDLGPWQLGLIEIFEIWCKYDIDDDGVPEHLVVTYHWPSKTVLQLRYNYYFHQKYPYVVIPYSITNDSIYGIGIAEMVKPFQDMLTRWQRMSTDNAYLANIRMFIARKNAGIEKTPAIYAGRVFHVDNPKEDFIPFAAAELYQSTISERENLFGLSEKRTGVSDYLTGRESPIVGSRATATSTMALIQEGTRRVEEVLENIRAGFAEMMEMCLALWVQYGLDGIDDVVFGDDQVAIDVKNFFDSVGMENLHGALAIDLAATDAAQNRSAQQQVQLAIIQTMMGYLEKVLSAGQQALMAPMQMGAAAPEYIAMVKDVMSAARKMFNDLLFKYDVPNPESYLPDLEQYLNVPQPQPQPATGGQPPQGGAPSSASQPTNSGGVPGIPPATGGSVQPAGAAPTDRITSQVNAAYGGPSGGN